MLPGSLVIPLGTTLTVAGDAHLILEANQILTNHGTLNLESPATIPHSGADPWFSVTIFLGGEVDNYGVMNIIQTSPHDGGGLETITSGSINNEIGGVINNNWALYQSAANAPGVPLNNAGVINNYGSWILLSILSDPGQSQGYSTAANEGTINNICTGQIQTLTDGGGEPIPSITGNAVVQIPCKYVSLLGQFAMSNSHFSFTSSLTATDATGDFTGKITILEGDPGPNQVSGTFSAQGTLVLSSFGTGIAAAATADTSSAPLGLGTLTIVLTSPDPNQLTIIQTGTSFSAPVFNGPVNFLVTPPQGGGAVTGSGTMDLNPGPAPFVTPVFPLGTVLSILVPLAAFGFYFVVITKRRRPALLG